MRLVARRIFRPLVSPLAPAATLAFFAVWPAAAPVVARTADPLPARRTGREGGILRIFDRTVVYVVTNDDAALADALLDGVNYKERRVLSPDEWGKLPAGTRWFVSSVFLINRQRLPAGVRLPDTCAAEPDETWTQVTRWGRDWGIAHDITISAPDGAWLRRAVADFRRLVDVPRPAPQRRSVRSVAIVPWGAGRARTVAENYAADLAQRNVSARDKPSAGRASAPVAAALLPHVLPGDGYASAVAGERLALADEVWLVDRSAAQTVVPAPVAAVLDAKAVPPGDTVMWRERKESGHARVIVSAPNADLLAGVLRHLPNPLVVTEAVTTLASARDLRQVRRVAVAGVKNGAGGPELARRLASVAAREVRALDAFEVLERAGLNQVLGEIALDQAGITRAGDRARVRQLAAADALLIVEVTSAQAASRYAAAQERLTPALGRPPRRPLEPSRLRYGFNLPGREDDPVTRAVSDALLKRVVGTKTDREYKRALDEYYRDTLPRWQQDADRYADACRRREIAWKQTVSAKQSVTVSGSLRLVDLVDGLVLWEAPFSATQNEDGTLSSRTVTSVGEDSQPDPAVCPPDSSDLGDVPQSLLDRAAEQALEQGIEALRHTAVLPPGAASEVASAAPAPSVAAGTALGPAPVAANSAPVAGRIFDVDGDTLLVGLGAGDGLVLGDTLLVRIGGGGSNGGAQIVRLVVTRVRPRTCDATFDKSAPAGLRARVVIGQTATPAEAKK